MQGLGAILGVIGIVLMVALWFRLADPTLWKQDMWKIGGKIAIALLAIGLTLWLLYLLAPDFVFE